MSGPDRQAALIIALDEAVGGALRRYGADGHGLHLGIRAALVDGLQVLAREFGPRPEDSAPPPMHELPTEPGAVIYVTGWTDPWAPKPLLAVLAGIGDGGLRWCTPTWGWPSAASGTPAVTIWFDPGQIVDWVPARVVPDDEFGPVAALHRIAHPEFDRKTALDEVVDELRTVARDALEAIDEQVPR